MKTVIIIEKGKDGTYSVYPAKGEMIIIGEGSSVEKAKDDFMNSYNEMKEYLKEKGKNMPSELNEEHFEYKYDISSLFNEFNFINVSKFAEWLGISPSLIIHFMSGNTFCSMN